MNVCVFRIDVFFNGIKIVVGYLMQKPHSRRTL